MEFIKKYLPAVSALLIAAAGCTPDNGGRRENPQFRITADSEIASMDAYRFDGGVLAEIFRDITPQEDGTYRLGAGEFGGTVYFIANSGLVPGFGELETGSGIEDFLGITASAGQMVSGDGFLMSGSAEIGRWMPQIGIQLKRSAARVDIESTDAGVEVLGAVIRNTAQEGPAVTGGTPAGADPGNDIVKDFSRQPLQNGKEILAYLCSQNNPTLEVEASVRFGGGTHRLVSRLPERIRENTVYTVKVFGQGGQVSIGISSADWDTSVPEDAETVTKLSVDTESSEFSAGVVTSPGKDTVYIPHSGAHISLALDNREGCSVSIEGSADKSEVSYEDGRVNISHGRKMPGSVDEYVYVSAYDGDVYKGRVVLCFKAHPVKISGRIRFDDDMVCDFGGYAEGVLGEMDLMEGINVSLRPEGARWAKIDTLDGVCRILGGWKPNDPEADGRVQETRLVLSGEGFVEEEEYVIRRLNWGLPVVRMGDYWWCKYNLRGNARSFEDQINMGNDPVSDADLQDYLTNCSGDELLALMGDQYQAGNNQGLPLRHDGEAYYHEGMKSSAPNWGSLGDNIPAPEGYRLPTYAEMGFFSWNDNCNLGGPGERPFNNRYGNRIYVNIVEREADFLGHSYGNVTTYAFKYEGNTWVMFGLGHQWTPDKGNISRKNIIFATGGHMTGAWNMEGYANSVKPGQNWMKFSSQNSTKTRTVRCIKTPPVYIYE